MKICSLKISLFLPLYFSFLIATPPTSIPEELYNEYTLNGQIPIVDLYIDDTNSQTPHVYQSETIDSYILDARARQVKYYGSTDTFLYNALDQYIDYIKDQNVAVIGSTIPWYESILLAYGAFPTTIEYNKIECQDPRLEVLTLTEFEENPKLFKAILSISSFEHYGLGRYGDPLDPNGDLQSMEKAKSMLQDGGLLFLAVPVGKDCVVWNAHRIYGILRLKMLLKGWRIVEYFGFTSEQLYHNQSLDSYIQPIFVLTPLKK